MTIVAPTYNQRRANMLNTLQESAQQQVDKRTNDEKTLRENHKQNTFTGTFGRSSRTVLAKRNAVTKRLMEEGAALLMCRILREAVPFDLSNVSDAELTEQVKLFKDTHAGIINEASLVQPTGVGGVDIESPTAVALFIGGQSSALQTKDGIKVRTPAQLAKDILSVNAACSVNGHKDANISTVLNVIDTSFCYGSEAEKRLDNKTDTQIGLSAVFEKSLASAGKQLGEAVRSRIAAALNEDAKAKMISDEDRYSGLSEAVVERMKLRERRKTKKVSLVEEVFKTVSVLNESHGATQADYLNEAVFQVAILEAYALLGCVDKTADQIALALHAKRLTFTK